MITAFGAWAPRRVAGRLKVRMVNAAGGPARARAVTLLACTLALQNADLATVGAAGPQLESGLRITSTELGLLAAVSTFVAAVMSLPFGALTDRSNRVKLLAIGVQSWAVMMVLSAIAQSYVWLLLARLGLGVVTAIAYPVIASLTGDYFAATERGRMYGYILSGELLGTGFGFVISGTIASALSWRWAFAVMAIPALALAAALLRGLKEPERGAQSERRSKVAPKADDDGEELARQTVLAAGVEPVPELVLRRRTDRLTLWQAVRYVLRIPTNRSLILASGIGYMFFAGLQTFAVVFVRGHFSLPQGSAIAILFVAGLGSLAGVLIAGRLGDRLLRGGIGDARILLGGIAYTAAALVLLPAVLVRSVAVAVPLLILAGAGLGAPNPPLDAARLDIMPSGLWGRAEAVRTFLRQSAEAGAPLLFGLIADTLGGARGAVLGGSAEHVSAATARGLEYAFLIMLVPLVLNGLVLLLRSRRSYPADVATAAASENAIWKLDADSRSPQRLRGRRAPRQAGRV